MTTFDYADPKDCKSNLANSIIWPASPPNSDVILDKCSAYFQTPYISGNICIGLILLMYYSSRYTFYFMYLYRSFK